MAGYNEKVKLYCDAPTNDASFTVSSGDEVIFNGTSMADFIEVGSIVWQYLLNYFSYFDNLNQYVYFVGGNTTQKDPTCPTYEGVNSSIYANVATTQEQANKQTYNKILQLNTTEGATFFNRGLIYRTYNNNIINDVVYILFGYSKNNVNLTRGSNTAYATISPFDKDSELATIVGNEELKAPCNILAQKTPHKTTELDEDFLAQVPLFEGNTYVFRSGVMYDNNNTFIENMGVDGYAVIYVDVPMYKYTSPVLLTKKVTTQQSQDEFYLFKKNSTKKQYIYNLWLLTENGSVRLKVTGCGNVEFTRGIGTPPHFIGESFNASNTWWMIDGFLPNYIGYTTSGVFSYSQTLLYKELPFTIFIRSENDPTIVGYISFVLQFDTPTSVKLSGSGNRITLTATTYEDPKSVKLYKIDETPQCRFYVKWRTSDLIDDCYPFKLVSKRTSNTSLSTYEDTDGVQVYATTTTDKWTLNTNWIAQKQVKRFSELFKSKDITLLDTKEGKIIPVYIENPEYTFKTLQNNDNKGFNIQVTLKAKETVTQ